jgi:multidrug efflux pump subunit AcrA (membrane-fusion protein)
VQQYQAGQINAEIARRQAESAKMQAKWAEYASVVAREKAERKASLRRRQMRRQIGTVRAAGGKAGVTGESLLVAEIDVAEKALADIEMIEWAGEVDYLTGKYRGQTAREQGGLYMMESALQSQGASTALALGAIRGGASLLSGTAKAGTYGYGTGLFGEGGGGVGGGGGFHFEESLPDIED